MDRKLIGPATLFMLLAAYVLCTRVALAQQSGLCTAIIVQPGDTLSTIAGEHLSNQLAYVTIVEATNAAAVEDSSYATVGDPNQIGVGWKLCIPPANATQPAPSASPTTLPTPTQNVAPANDIVPAATPVETTSTVTAVAPITPTPAITAITTLDGLGLAAGEIHPLMVEYMRGQDYPGSDIIIEQVLDPGSNYNRYIASYLSEGNKIFALLTIPHGPKPTTGWPVIIFNHGYIPPEIYRTTERYVAYVDAFARNGYIVFRSDYRGHGFSEGEPTSSRGSPAYTIDVLNAVSSIQRFADADSQRIGMWGHSMGGLLTLRSMVTTGDVKAGVIWAGVVASYVELYERSQSQANRNPPPVDPTTANRRRWREEIVEKWGTPQENPTIWAAISPNSYLSDLSGPMQLHHGSLDSDVPVEWSRTLHQQILAVDGSVEYYEYAGDNHNISVNLNTALARSVAFFDTYLK